MAWVKFTSGFRWKPSPQVAQVYRAGSIHNVPTACANAAAAKGKAIRMKKPKREAAPVASED